MEKTACHLATEGDLRALGLTSKGIIIHLKAFSLPLPEQVDSWEGKKRDLAVAIKDAGVERVSRGRNTKKTSAYLLNRLKSKTIQCGWMHFSRKFSRFVAVRSTSGGGVFNHAFEKSSSKVDIIKVMTDKFFPNGKSQKHGYLANMIVEIGDHRGQVIMDENFMLGPYCEAETQQRCRTYLLTTKKTPQQLLKEMAENDYNDSSVEEDILFNFQPDQFRYTLPLSQEMPSLSSHSMSYSSSTITNRNVGFNTQADRVTVDMPPTNLSNLCTRHDSIPINSEVDLSTLPNNVRINSEVDLTTLPINVPINSEVDFTTLPINVPINSAFDLTTLPINIPINSEVDLTTLPINIPINNVVSILTGNIPISNEVDVSTPDNVPIDNSSIDTAPEENSVQSINLRNRQGLLIPSRYRLSIGERDQRVVNPLKITVRRVMLLRDLIEEVKNIGEEFLFENVELAVTNHQGNLEKGADIGGVFRDILSGFWQEFYMGYGEGEDAVVPLIRHDLNASDWRAVALIFLKGYKDFNFLPIKLSLLFLTAALYGEGVIDEEDLLQGLFVFLPLEERKLFQNILDGDNNDDFDEDVNEQLLDSISSLSCIRMPKNKTELRKLLVEVAHKKIIQEPSYIKDCFKDVFSVFPLCANKAELYEIYNKAKPTAAKVIRLIECAPSTERELETLNYLKRFIRTLSLELLQKFLRFVTGGSCLCVDSIKINFVTLSGFERRFVSHCCGSVLELPLSYEDYGTFKSEFNTQLSSNYWSMDIV